jgi:hypothetical protein
VRTNGDLTQFLSDVVVTHVSHPCVKRRQPQTGLAAFSDACLHSNRDNYGIGTGARWAGFSRLLCFRGSILKASPEILVVNSRRAFVRGTVPVAPHFSSGHSYFGNRGHYEFSRSLVNHALPNRLEKRAGLRRKWENRLDQSLALHPQLAA